MSKTCSILTYIFYPLRIIPMPFECKLCSGWGRWTEVVHGQVCSGTCARCKGRGRLHPSRITHFWLVHYYPARFAQDTWDARRRHARVRLFTFPTDAALFADQVWHSPHWRLLDEAEVRRTGIGFESVLPF